MRFKIANTKSDEDVIEFSLKLSDHGGLLLVANNGIMLQLHKNGQLVGYEDHHDQSLLLHKFHLGTFK